MEKLNVYVVDMLADILGRNQVWMVEAFTIVFITLLCAFAVSIVFRSLQKKAQYTKTLWDDALFVSLERPAKFLVWLLGLSYAASLVGARSESTIFDAVDSIRYIGAVLIINWFLLGFIRRTERNFMSPDYCHKPVDETTASAISKLLRAAVMITSVLILLQYFKVEIRGLLAFGGIGGIAVGFAAKDLLANFFGGLMIYMDRPFKVGDWIRSDDKSIEGTVEDIGWRLTRIRTFDKRPLYVPNSTFTQISVENASRMTNRRIYETIGIRYDDAKKMAGIIRDVKMMLNQHDEIDHDTTMIVNFNAFASSSLDFFVYCFTRTINWIEFHEVKQDVLLKVLDIINAHGAECAFPTSTIHVPALAQAKSENIGLGDLPA